MKEQPKISALLNNPAADFAFFSRGNQVYLFEGLRPLNVSQGLGQNEMKWIHAPQFFHLRYEFLTFDQFRIFQREELTAPEPPPEVDLGGWIPPRFQSYEAQFNHIQELIFRSKIKKAVPVVFEQTGGTPHRHQIFQMIQNLLKAENVFCYGLVRGQEGVLGGTPEFLFSLSGNHLESLAVAGTKWERENGGSPSWSSRLAREHELVIEDLEKKLKVLGTVTKGALEEVQVGFLRHLKTRLSCQLNSQLVGIKDLYFLIKKLHPSAALGLSSRELSWKEMEYWPGQEFRRGSFGAPLTFRWSNSEALSLVAIRQVFWDQSGSRIGAGGGIVDGSNLSEEWRELENKIKYVKSIFGIK